MDFGRFGEGGVFLPATAVKTDGKASWVFVVANGKAEKREVVAAAVHPGTVAVKQGLAARRRGDGRAGRARARRRRRPPRELTHSGEAT